MYAPEKEKTRIAVKVFLESNEKDYNKKLFLPVTREGEY